MGTTADNGRITRLCSSNSGRSTQVLPARCWLQSSCHLFDTYCEKNVEFEGCAEPASFTFPRDIHARLRAVKGFQHTPHLDAQHKVSGFVARCVNTERAR
jgi:hypothetical protein